MAVTLTQRLVRRYGLLAARHVHFCNDLSFAEVQRTNIGRHRDLLEQQTKQRNQRDPAAVAWMKSHGTSIDRSIREILTTLSD